VYLDIHIFALIIFLCMERKMVMTLHVHLSRYNCRQIRYSWKVSVNLRVSYLFICSNQTRFLGTGYVLFGLLMLTNM